jgi:hypothetical protein
MASKKGQSKGLSEEERREKMKEIFASVLDPSGKLTSERENSTPSRRSRKLPFSRKESA